MIDIEHEVFDSLCDLLTSQFPGINVTGENVAAPSEFPCVSVEEADNYAVGYTQDSGSNENHAKIMYEITAFSNKAVGRKSECKAIFAIVDGYFQQLGFTRISLNPALTGNSKVYRLVGRYTAVVSQNQTIYRR